MRLEGLEFAFATIRDLEVGRCPACERFLPPEPRPFAFTCDATCHGRWIDSLVARYGPTRDITDARTGVVYIVPTRLILEHGITAADLQDHPVRSRRG